VEDGPLVSIVTPSLNQGRYIEDAIESVAAQDYPRIEHIVVDGGSTDGTLDVLRRFPELRWVSEPDRGQADAIAKGFAMTRGEILAWLNADDVYLPGAVSAAVEALRTTGAALVYGSWLQIDENGRTLKEVPVAPFDYRELLEIRNMIAQPTAFFRRGAYEAVGGVDPSFHFALDYELWLKLGAKHDVATLERPLAAFRFHPDSKTVAQSSLFWRETRRASRRHGARVLSPMARRELATRHPFLLRLHPLLRAARNLRAKVAVKRPM
jgi:glycosyltransferase involved in cell wall biosynthesis